MKARVGETYSRNHTIVEFWDSDLSDDVQFNVKTEGGDGLWFYLSRAEARELGRILVTLPLEREK